MVNGASRLAMVIFRPAVSAARKTVLLGPESPNWTVRPQYVYNTYRRAQQ
jgi:hypothetical protein